MPDSHNPTVLAVQEAVLNMLELVKEAAFGLATEEADALREEAQETVLAFIAAIVMSDGKYDTAEQEFLQIMVSTKGKPGGDLEYLKEYAERWQSVGTQVPRFFRTAVQYDETRKTETAPAMMRELQIVGNNTCVSDKRFASTEGVIVRHYLTLLDAYIATGEPQDTDTSITLSGETVATEVASRSVDQIAAGSDRGGGVTS